MCIHYLLMNPRYYHPRHNISHELRIIIITQSNRHELTYRWKIKTWLLVSLQNSINRELIYFFRFSAQYS